jgi:hypothetical protein
MTAHAEFKGANEKYASTFGDKASLPLPPGKKLIVGEHSHGVTRLSTCSYLCASDLHGRSS